VTEGYKQEEADREAFETTTTAHFIEALENDPRSDEARVLARELGFDPDARFRVLELSGTVTVGEAARALVWKLVTAGCVASTVRRGRGAIVIAQGVTDRTLTESLDAIPPDTATGVGTEASGPEGVLTSMREAHLALAVAAAFGRVSRFDEDWLLSMLFTHGDAVDRLLDAGIRIALAKPHLADAVHAYANSEFSIAQSSALLQISPSSQRYRLSRWRHHTGWDPSTFDGLTRSLVAIDASKRRAGDGTRSGGNG
jgi:DNA-binding PucR family transcriptional regulator